VIGAISLQDVKEAFESTYAFSDFHPGMGAIWDYSQGTIEHLSQVDLHK